MVNFCFSLNRTFGPVIVLLLLVVGLASCGRPDNFQPKGALAFSDDSVKFDTIFTTVKSATQRLYIYNNSGNNILIDRVNIENGSESVFEMILDGVPGNDQSKIELANGDSLIAFFTMKSRTDGGDLNLTDILNFRIGTNTQRITLFARVLDAYIFRDTVIKAGSNFRWPVDKPVVVDGFVLVDTNASVSIPAGSKVYFSARRDRNFNFFSQIFTRGTLTVNEEGGEPVLFTSFRINKDYNDQAGQWQGIRFSRSSTGSLINRAIIKNCVIGVQVDSFALDNQPKCTIQNTEILNCSNFGILGLGSVLSNAPLSNPPIILCYNTLVANVGQSAVGLFFGGRYEFFHNTFYASRAVTFNRSQPVFGFQNFSTTESGAVDKVFDSKLTVQNCIVWGTNDEEFVISAAAGAAFEPLITHNLLKTKTEPARLPISNKLNTQPRFKTLNDSDPPKSDFKLTEISPARDGGQSLNRLAGPIGLAAELNRDLAGTSRNSETPDIGAYEFK